MNNFNRIKRLLGLLTIIGFLTVPTVVSGRQHHRFRLYLADKGPSPYSVGHPRQFLSAEAIERRRSQGIPVDESDLPISQTYLDSIARTGATPVARSKWLRTVVVDTPDSTWVHRLENLSFVDSVKEVWRGAPATKPAETAGNDDCSAPEGIDDPYGYAGQQIRLHNGQRLHAAGFRGQGMRIAVIDAGFISVDQLTAFDSLRIGGTHNFVFPGQSVYTSNDHGTKVLSCLAADLPGVMIGTAPEAEYWLLVSEDTRSEFPVEEDYWIAAVEYADSVGVDVISSSLGYFTFDDDRMEYGKEALDGKTAPISRAAETAASKGMLLFSSAGNEGNGSWEKIAFPADAPSVVTVGSVTGQKIRSSFSSKGLTADCRIKPDVVALGSSCCVVDTEGQVQHADGTSFATPVLAGLGACLWQALPQLSSREVVQLLRASADHAAQPDAETGYGIPDVYRAYRTHCNPDAPEAASETPFPGSPVSGNGKTAAGPTAGNGKPDETPAAQAAAGNPEKR